MRHLWTGVGAGAGGGWEDLRELYPANPSFDLLLFAKQSHDEEAVIDQGRTSNVVNIHYEKEELEGGSLRGGGGVGG